MAGPGRTGGAVDERDGPGRGGKRETPSLGKPERKFRRKMVPSPPASDQSFPGPVLAVINLGSGRNRTQCGGQGLETVT